MLVNIPCKSTIKTSSKTHIYLCTHPFFHPSTSPQKVSTPPIFFLFNLSLLFYTNYLKANIYLLKQINEKSNARVGIHLSDHSAQLCHLHKEKLKPIGERIRMFSLLVGI